jgi:TonB family protein
MHTALRVICTIVVSPLLFCAAVPKRLTQAEAMELVTARVQPDYPAMARQLNLTGVVEVEIVVGENGAVESASPVSGSPVLTRPAADALKRWKFKPLQENGAPAGFRATIKVSFTK